MNTQHAIAAMVISLLSTTALAADTPAQSAQADSKPVLLASAATAAGSTAAAAATTATTVVTAATGTAATAATNAAGRSRDEVRAEAVEAVRNHRSTMSQQYDLLK
ncbi:hypothetical protein GCM10027277_46270 [Pseudoduganella ginsengisoli]|uniref:DUF4148 domain-containing protein n=1 Tax=Pseudoduganella ginsengisoli TaxID=1462440 RepID=A0A6L6Q975_9BURK|nr:hypothetical protein [Pseudoduganella ginsengisoli]MTW05728.1 hypothetical protein [Pseudoduganella ginsengisoli]